MKPVRMAVAAAAMTAAVATASPLTANAADIHDAETPRAAATASSQWACGYGAFCVYSGYNGWGTRKQMYSCNVNHRVSFRFYSYRNNQTPGTRAIWKDSRGRKLGVSKPAPGRTGALAAWIGYRTWYVEVC